MAVKAVRLIAYVLFNIISSTCIVFANKIVMSTLGFHFPYTLMLLVRVQNLTRCWHLTGISILSAKLDAAFTKFFASLQLLEPVPYCDSNKCHKSMPPLYALNALTLQLVEATCVIPQHATFTWCGIETTNFLGMFQRKPIAKTRMLPIAIAFVAFVVFGNINLQWNTVTFYQITKIAVPPAVVAIEYSMFGKSCTVQKLCAVAVVCGGVWMATVTDPEVSLTLANISIGGGAVISAAVFQVLAGREQKELGLSSLQLLQEYSPSAVAILSVLVPCIEKIGWLQVDRTPATVMGFPYSSQSIMAICFSASCGLMVTLSSFLVIGSTSPLTYNIVGHSKTVVILAGGALLFHDDFSIMKAFGVAVAFVGIVWYSLISILCPEREANSSKSTSTMTTTVMKVPAQASQLADKPSSTV